MYPSKQSLLVRLYPNSQFCQTQNAAQNQACFLGEKKKDLQTILNALIIFFFVLCYKTQSQHQNSMFPFCCNKTLWMTKNSLSSALERFFFSCFIFLQNSELHHVSKHCNNLDFVLLLHSSCNRWILSYFTRSSECLLDLSEKCQQTNYVLR